MLQAWICHPDFTMAAATGGSAWRRLSAYPEVEAAAEIDNII